MSLEQRPIVYNLDEVAEILQVTRRTIYNHLKAGNLKAVKIGKYWKVSKENLQEFIMNGAPPIHKRNNRGDMSNQNGNPA